MKVTKQANKVEARRSTGPSQSAPAPRSKPAAKADPPRAWHKAPTLEEVRSGKEVLKAGDRGPAVRRLQEMMNETFQKRVQEDGTFGHRMEGMLRNFQRKHGLSLTGRLNAATLALLEKPSDAGQTPWAAGLRNGYVPDGKMEEIPGPGSFKLWPQAAEAYRAMYAAAKADGLTLSLTGSYRSYAAQVYAHQQKPTLTAEPGTSRHGWGLAVDVRTDDDWTRTFAWLSKNAAKFGFRGITSGGNAWAAEAWHWQYEPTGRWDPP